MEKNLNQYTLESKLSFYYNFFFNGKFYFKAQLQDVKYVLFLVYYFVFNLEWSICYNFYNFKELNWQMLPEHFYLILAITIVPKLLSSFMKDP